MKQFIIIFAVLTFIVITSNAGWFSHDDAHKEQIAHLQNQLQQQQQSTGDWQGIAFLFGIGSVVTLVVGAAIGSKGKRDAKR